jgi:hypothetical protein
MRHHFGMGDPEILADECLLVPQLFVVARRFDSVGTIGVGRFIGQIHIVASGSNLAIRSARSRIFSAARKHSSAFFRNSVMAAPFSEC